MELSIYQIFSICIVCIIYKRPECTYQRSIIGVPNEFIDSTALMNNTGAKIEPRGSKIICICSRYAFSKIRAYFRNLLKKLISYVNLISICLIIFAVSMLETVLMFCLDIISSIVFHVFGALNLYLSKSYSQCNLFASRMLIYCVVCFYINVKNVKFFLNI